MIKLAVVVTCHNREPLTLNLVRNLLLQAEGVVDARIFVCDAGSTDGTADALREFAPRVEVIAASKSIYWAAGMRIAYKAALAWNPDWYLLVNDDLEVHERFLASFVGDSRGATMPQVLIGEVQDLSSGKIIYGARTQSRADLFSFQVDQDGQSEITTFNANAVFISTAAFALVHGFPKKYRHGYADFVLGLRLSRAKVTMRRLSEVAGFGESNPVYNKMYDGDLAFRVRVQAAISPFGIPPRDHLRFCREVAGPWVGLLRGLLSYRRVLYPPRRRGADAESDVDIQQTRSSF